MGLQPNAQPGPPYAPDLPQLGVGILQAMPVAPPKALIDDAPFVARAPTRPVVETPFVGTSLGFAPAKFQRWAVDPDPRPFRPKPAPDPSLLAFGQLGCQPTLIESTTGQLGGSNTSVSTTFAQAQVLNNTNIVV